ncbi:ankyrin repeat domain-containing protein [Streptomyces sp. NBC_01212]|uniref:ankyrin repeat domain-containing protein n=1 Tax=Streptomyces sp. NBC_01212 TaxID=2903775 RepID=UPI002E10A5C9|nr:ankyrin repeat domain-containing protein [Streptomyces sp. NBC_01212]
MSPWPKNCFLPTEEASSLHKARRYAVPRRMIERATERRLAGDWRGALAAAHVEPAFDLAEVATAYGPVVAGALASDLRHLVPDLVHWHVPRALGGRSTVATGRTVVLAGYGNGSGLPLAPYLHLSTPPMFDGPQGLVLRFGAVPDEGAPGVFGARTEDWRAERWLWDARHTARLREAVGAAGRIPFLRHDGTPLSSRELAAADDAGARAERVTLLHQEGRVSEAFAAAGVDWDPALPEAQRSWRGLDVEENIRRMALDIPRLGPAVRRATATGGGERFLVAMSWRAHLLLDITEHSTGGRLRARVVERETPGAASAARLPEAAWRRLPDLDLLRSGAMPPQWLHPLVARALFPAVEGPFGPPGPPAPRPVRVRCRGEWHEVVFRDGALRSPHTDEERQRESALRAFGGAVAGCFAVEHSCTSGTGRLPKALRAQVRELFLHAQHGDTTAVLAMLDAGVDLRVKDARQRGLLHVLPLLDHEALLPRLLEAGLDLEARDHMERTPLGVAVGERGSAALVRALLDAGARTDVTDATELSLSQTIRRYKRTDLAFLRERVEAEHPGIGSAWYDKWFQEDAEDEEQ